MINSLFPDIDLLSAVRLNSNGNFALIFQPFHLASISVFFCFVFFSYLWDRVCSFFSGAGKFCLAHGLGQPTQDT